MKDTIDTIDEINIAWNTGTITREEANTRIINLDDGNTYVYCEDVKEFLDVDYAWKSDYSNSWYSEDKEQVEVVRDTRADITCTEEEAELIGFRCNDTDRWYHNDDYTRIECDGDILCEERCYCSLYYWESDNCYHYDEESDDSADYDSDGRACYHSTKRMTHKLEGIGVELEMECHKNMYDLCNIARDSGLVAEEDASLNDESGVELVGPVIKFEEYKNWNTWGKVFDAFPNHQCKGHNAGTGYGIHVSMSLSLFSDLDLSKFVLFFNTCSDLCKIVAQRKTIYSGSYGIQKKHKLFKKKRSTGKYEPVSIDDYRAEVRIFRSTLRKDRFLKNIEFCEAVRVAVKDMSARTVLNEEAAQKAFLAFVKKEKATYPNLYQFLVEQGLIIKIVKPIK